MFEELKEKMIGLITSRTLVLCIAAIAVAVIIVERLFSLQIVHGEEYLDSFETKIMKERTISGSRGCIYDRNGNLLAYNELAHSVTIEDVYESGKMKNSNLNHTIETLIQMIEKNGDSIVSDFKIILDDNGKYAFTVEDTQLLRFLADVYGKSSIDDLTVKQKTATAEEVVEYLCGWNRFRIGEYTSEDTSDTFVPGNGYSKETVLKILTVRYDMNTNSYQKYIATTVATDVSEETVAVIMENNNELEGVSIAEDTIRKYVDSIYFAPIIGYTGKVDQDELAELSETNDSYDLNDTVGKLGIEKSMESWLQGTKGSETVFVDNLGKVIESIDYVESAAGNDVYLTIDRDLQIACYRILEENLAGILYTNIINAREFDTENVSSSQIKIPIYDVYFALINNNIIDIDHFTDAQAGENEKAVGESFQQRKEEVFARLNEELTVTKTTYENLSAEYQVYESYIAKMLYNDGILDREKVDTEDETYIAWTTDEVISLYDYLNYCISQNWVDVSKLSLNSQYSDSEEIYMTIIAYIFDQLDDHVDFAKSIYKYMIKDDTVSGRQICLILLEQDVIDVDEETVNSLYAGRVSAYDFMKERIRNLDITPAQLALDPCNASMVITDVNTGDVLALVSYPGYDNNKMANGVDAEYFASLRSDLSSPMLNYATQQRTAPGSTFKMVSATAGFLDGVIDTSTTFFCNGLFDLIDPSPRCWIYGRGSHGSLNVTGAIKNSCNVFFYELGYRLGMTDDGYSSEQGLERLSYYADLYGLSETSGVEIEEYAPQISTSDAVRSAIGQGTNNYTTVSLARYVTTVANSGTCYDLTLIDKVTDRSGSLLYEQESEVRNTVDLSDGQWNAIHTGMRQVVESKSYFSDLSVAVAGKTGTAEENKNRANHALFVCYAPYEEPEIAIATRIAYGYSSNYAATTTKDVISYYFGLADEEELITDTAAEVQVSTTQTD